MVKHARPCRWTRLEQELVVLVWAGRTITWSRSESAFRGAKLLWNVETPGEYLLRGCSVLRPAASHRGLIALDGVDARMANGDGAGPCQLRGER